VNTHKNVYLYLETNVLAYLSNQEIFDFIPGTLAAGSRLVTSDIALSELISGRETAILKKHKFLYVLAHEPFFIEGSIKYYSSIPVDTDPVDTDPIEKFLRGMLRSVSGNPTLPDLNSLFRSGILEVTDAMMEDLPEGTDPRLVRQLEEARIRFRHGLSQLPALPSPVVPVAELEALKLGPKHLGNIRPPEVLNKIRKTSSIDAEEWLDGLLLPIREGEDIKARIQELCLALLGLGFARDRSILSQDASKSEAGAKAQFNDISHICAAATCTALVTADKRCAKLAFAVYEALGLNTRVIHLRPQREATAFFNIVGENYWP
jgi:hypothetical protein